MSIIIIKLFEHLLSQKQQQLTSSPTQTHLQVYDLDQKEGSLLTQSHLAFCAVHSYDQDRIARAVSEEIVSESESDNPEDYTALSDLGKDLITG